ncbi:MAG: Nif3-like dinuclear metal center hexameric protein [Bacteroidetes bacterium]|nr:Nif3-like dinuclear metal center hexameric protein [Bacteroidota bacterium]
MTIQDIVSYLETIAPLSLQEGYDNAGLLTGNRKTEVTGALICLDSLESVIDEAITLNCNLVIAHHPIIFGGLKRLNGNNYIERTIIKAIKHDIAIYAIHTNLDNVRHGVNAKIAEKLGLISTRVLSPKQGILKKLVTFAPVANAGDVRFALFEAGGGHIGHYDHCSFSVEGTGTFRGDATTNPYVGTIGEDHFENEERIEVIFPSYLQSKLLAALIKVHPYEEVAYDIYSLDNKFQDVGAGLVGVYETPMEEMEFLQKLKQTMQCGAVRHTKLSGKPVRKVALCGGSGAFLLKDAIAAGADVYVSADFKYHEFFDADSRLVIADIGHYESEQYTIELISDLLMKKFATFAVHLSKINTNPINYL